MNYQDTVKIERQYELKLSNGKRVVWNGKDGIDAAHRYVDCIGDKNISVIAWRDYPRYGIFPGILKIEE